jgi:CheY-like chemotaxis protein
MQEQEFNLLLSDIDMPTMDGISLADVVHRLHPYRPVFLFSGQINDASVRQRIGALRLPVHLETKPLKVDSLVSVVHDLLTMGDSRRLVVETAPREMAHSKFD